MKTPTGDSRKADSLESTGLSASPSSSVTEFPARELLPATEPGRRLLDRLTAQQASLVRAVALGDADYLNRSFYRDPATGKRIAYELDGDELSRFAARWKEAPVECIREMNQALARIGEPPRLNRYLEAAVDLEILMDRETWPTSEGEIHRGIPAYLMNGYTDMGSLSSPTERNGREKIKVDKERMRPRLLESKRQGVEGGQPTAELLAGYYDAVRREIEFDELGVEKMSREFGSESIVLSRYLEKGMGVCRHLSIFYQLYLQEAGIFSRVVKGNLRFFVFNGRHAWNLASLAGQVALVDVTHPDVDRPFILLGASEEEVYRAASDFNRSYTPTPDHQNHYKIGF